MTHYDHPRLAKPDRPADAAHRPDANRATTLRPDTPGARGGCGSGAHCGRSIRLLRRGGRQALGANAERQGVADLPRLLLHRPS